MLHLIGTVRVQLVVLALVILVVTVDGAFQITAALMLLLRRKKLLITERIVNLIVLHE